MRQPRSGLVWPGHRRGFARSVLGKEVATTLHHYTTHCPSPLGVKEGLLVEDDDSDDDDATTPRQASLSRWAYSISN